MAKSDVLVRMKANTQGYDANIAKARRQLDQFKKDNLSMGGVLKQLNGNMLATATRFASVTAAVGAIGAAFKSNIETARGFEKSMSQLSSLTGMVGSDLEKLKGYSIELGSSTTLSASQVADAFKLIGAQQPQLLASGEALKSVTKNAITLAEAAGIELADAAKTLSVSINQMGGDSANAERYINVLAAASQKGAGDIAWLGEAITKSGTTAKAVGTDYEELVANLEQLAKAGYDASTAGTALRSIIMNLEKQSNSQFKPSVVGLTEAFKNLGEANLTLTQYQELTGKMFAAQAKALAEAAGEAENMKVQITGTNTAEEQAKTNTDNLDGSLKSLASAWEGLNLHLNASNGYLRTVVDWLKDVVVWADKAIVGLGEVKGNRAQLNGEGGGNTRVDRQIGNLENTNINRRQAVYSQQVEKYWRYINDWEKKLKEAESRTDVFAWETIKKNNDIATAKDNIAGAKSMLSEYQQRAGGLLTKGTGGGVGNIGNTTINVDADTEEAKKSIKELQNEIKKLKVLRDDAADAGDTEMRNQYNSQIKSIQDQIKSMRGGTGGSKTIKTEEQLNNEEIQKLTQEYLKASEQRQEAIRAEIKTLQDRNKEIQMMKDEATGKVGTPIIGMRGIEQSPIGITNENPFEKYKTAAIELVTPLQQLEDELKRLQEEQAKAWSPEVFAAYQNKINETQGKIKEFKGGTGTDAKETAESWKGAAQAISAVGNAMSSIENPAAQVMATVAQAIATIALTYAQSLKGTFTPWDWIAGAAAGMAQMISAISAIHASTGYADGGMIKGNSYSGDNIGGLVDGNQLVGLNAGEIVLNQAQQANVANGLTGGVGGNLNLHGVIKGEDILITADRSARRQGKGELVFWR